jgi:Amylo-alpha-1,6-glucosidase
MTTVAHSLEVVFLHPAVATLFALAGIALGVALRKIALHRLSLLVAAAMVWPWLLGPFITAYTKVHENSEAACKQAEVWLSALKDHLADAGLGHVSEIFDGDPPHRARGCIAQAWSVAELLQTTVEDIRGVRPTFEPLQAIVPATVSPDSRRIRKTSRAGRDPEKLGTSAPRSDR